MDLKYFDIGIEKSDLEDMIYGIDELAESLRLSAYTYSQEGLGTIHRELSEQENRDQWLREHYEVMQGALRLIAVSARVIGNAITDDCICFAEVKK